MVNPLLALQVQPPTIDVAGSLARGQEMKTARLGNILAEYKLKQAKDADQRTNSLASLYNEIGPGLASGDEGAINQLAAVDPESALGFREKAATLQKTQGDVKKADIEIAKDRAEFIGRTAAGVLEAPAEARPLLYQRALQQAKEMGVDVSGAPPQYDETAVRSMMDQALSVKDRIDAHLAQEKADATKANEARDDKYRAENDAANRDVTIRGQNLTDARARETNSRTGWREMTKDEKKAAGLPAESAYQVNGQGKIERVAGNTSVRPIPSSALAGIQSNRRTLTKIDKAIEALEKNPDAIGMKTYLGDAVTQRTDPGGVSVRALVADVGSQKLHDRSGAAITLSEAPRLQPFVPSVHDRADAAITKLKNLRAEYEASTDEAEAFYSPEAGYMSLPSRGANASPGNSGGKAVDGAVIDFNDLPDN